jgi:hypothetical protein
MKNHKPYFWLFEDSIKKDVDTNLFIGCIRKTDVLYTYNYKHNYTIYIWEFKELNNTLLKDISINENINLGNIKFGNREVLNKDSNPEITVSYGPFFKHTMNINFDEYSEINEYFQSNNYKGFCGVIHKMSLSNKDGKHLVLMDFYDVTRYFAGLIYIGKRGFYLILITSKNPVNKDIIEILNLE